MLYKRLLRLFEMEHHRRGLADDIYFYARQSLHTIMPTIIHGVNVNLDFNR